MLSPLLTFSSDSKGKHSVESISFYWIDYQRFNIQQWFDWVDKKNDMSLYSIWQASTLNRNRFVVGTKLSTEIDLVPQTSTVMPDKIVNCSTILTNNINAINNVNVTI